MTKQKQIEGMAQIIFNSKYKNGDISPLKGANKLYNAGYRKIPKNALIFTWEEYIDLSRNYVGEQIERARKETAKEIIKQIKGIKNIGSLRAELDMIAIEYGVEVEE